MGGDVERVKERLDIVEVLTPYLKLEKAGANFKARCPFHNEKTPSFTISPGRQSFYCFGCGAKGDIFTFIQEVEGMDFREALKFLAEKAGVELSKAPKEDAVLRTEKDRLIQILDESASFYEKELANTPEALEYLKSRGINEESIKNWRIGLARNEWRFLYSHLKSIGFTKELILKAGLAKEAVGAEGKEPYDVFRGRVVFPLFDSRGKIVGFSGRAFGKEVEPKYLNSPDTVLFTKSELLYGLDKAREDIRKKDYAVLVEGQIDLVLSHQTGVHNTVASSGTAFTNLHLERLKKLSPRIILAFDGDTAGEKAAEKSAILGMSLGMEVKIASLPEGKDPADLILSDADAWKNALRESKPAIEHFLILLSSREEDKRKLGKLVEKRILPLILLLGSAIERSHFISLIAKKTGIREEVLWEDLRRAKAPEFAHITQSEGKDDKYGSESGKERLPKKTNIERRLLGIIFWQENLAGESRPLLDVSTLTGEVVRVLGQEYFSNLRESLEIEKEELVFEAESYHANSEELSKEVSELLDNLSEDVIRNKLSDLIAELSRAEAVGKEEEVRRISGEIASVHNKMRELEEKRKMV